MTNDDLFESESYFNRKFDPDKAEARERLKAKRELNQPEEKPLHGERLLRRIADDSTEPYSVRMDARRLLEVADLRPRDFQREYDDFLAWRSENSK
jgi:hypothetical protein